MGLPRCCPLVTRGIAPAQIATCELPPGVLWVQVDDLSGPRRLLGCQTGLDGGH